MTRARPGLSFRIVRFTTDGKPDLSLTLPTNNWNGNGVYLDDRDRIIARANDELQLLTSAPKSDDEEARWETLAPCGFRCQVFQSLSRRTFYIDTWDADPEVAILDAENPSSIRHCRLPPFPESHSFADIKRCPAPCGAPVQSITDDFAYFNLDTGFPGEPPVLYRWPLCDFDRRTELPVRGRFQVLAISDDLFLLAGDVYGADGKLNSKITAKLARQESAGVQGIAGISEHGGRVALTAGTWKGGHPALDIGGHMTAERIIIYGIVEGEELASIPIHPFHVELYPAMSPDGHRVAALTGDILTVADVP